MLGSEMLDVAIGLVLVYLLLSTLASGLREVVAYFLDHRADHLETGIKFLLKDEATGLAGELYNHPLIREVPEDPKGGQGRRPINIPSRSFSLALMEMMARKAGEAAVDAAAAGASTTTPSVPPATPAATAPPAGPAATPPAPPSAPTTASTPPTTAVVPSGGSTPPAPSAGGSMITLASVRAGVATIEDDSVRRALLTALDTAQGSLDRAQKNMEAWFNSAMQRVSTWYRRQSQRIVIGIAILLTLGLNVNTLAIIDQLSKDDTLRAQIVEDAQAKSTTAGQPGGDVRQGYDELQALELPIGWADGWPGVQRALRPPQDRFRLWEDAAEPILGWIITIFAVALGAPFWFNLLSSMIRVRSGLLAAGSSKGAEAEGGASG